MNDIFYLKTGYIRNACKFVGLTDDQTSAVLVSQRAALKDEKLVELSLNWVKDIFTPDDIFEEVELADWTIPKSAPLLPLIVLFSGLDDIRQFYADNDLSENELITLLYDVNRNLNECIARNGSYIIEDFVFKWLIKHFTARLFQFGRLQYEVLHFYDDCGVLNKGDPVINVHIPSGGRMPYEDVRISYKTAVDFFEKFIPDVQFKGLICESWMLSPQLNDLLDGSSNIIRFLCDYQIFRTDDDEGFYANVFIKKPEDLQLLSEESSLQRAIKAYLLSGGKLLSGRGFIPVEYIK